MTGFAVRHIGPTPAEQQHMLDGLGYSSLDELTTAALPDGTPPAGLRLPDPLTETGRWPSCAGWPAGTSCSPR